MILLATAVLRLVNKKIVLTISKQQFIIFFMILFLDTVSPLPEFSVIDDNKIIFSQKIFDDYDQKMSDSILPIYAEIENKLNLRKKIKYLVVSKGPGSYTALRVGISFLSGLSLSTGIPIIGISCMDVSSFLINRINISSTAVYILSSNNQKYIYSFDMKKKEQNIVKIEKNESLLNIDLSNIKKLLTNDNSVFADLILPNKIEFIMFNFKETVAKFIDRIILLPNSEIINPIYISNNKILN